MCYSFEASMVAGTGLGLAGVGMVAKAWRSDRRMLAFATFPLVFAVHQFTEGVVWRSLCACGALLAAYLAYRLAGADGIDVKIVRHSLAYDPLFERPPLVTDLLYVALTVGPLMVFANRAVNAFGVAVFATFVYALVQNREAWYSVWCLAAAAFSFILAFAIEGEKRSTMDEAPA